MRIHPDPCVLHTSTLRHTLSQPCDLCAHAPRLLQVPVFFVVTKIDLAPEHVMKHTLQTLSGILKKPGVR